MDKRRIILGEYNSAEHGWTLSACQFSAAKYKEHLVEKPGGDGSWDLSTALSYGIPRYRVRTLTAVLERSDGNRTSREEEIRSMVNALDGMQLRIYLPDDTDRYIVGRVSVARNYNDLAHAAVSVTATCEPWKYNRDNTVLAITATQTEQVLPLVNTGRRAVVPTLEIEGEDASVRVAYGASSWAFSAGTYQAPDILLTPGVHELKVSGSGLLRVTYREAVLE